MGTLRWISAGAVRSVCWVFGLIRWDCYLWQQESKDRLAYLIDVFMFTPKDIELNCEVLTWPARINPVFDENDVVCMAVRLCLGPGWGVFVVVVLQWRYD